MRPGVWLLGDQLSQDHAALRHLEHQLGAEQARQLVRVVMIESHALATRRACHRQKLVLVWSAMRHFATELRRSGWQVAYLEADTVVGALQPWIAREGIAELHLMEPAERPFREAISRLVLAIPLVWHGSNAFLWSRDEFAAWARPYRQLRMELFYREGRRRFAVLMGADGDPLGGRWNYDQDNRKPPPRGLEGPPLLRFEADAVTRAVIAKVDQLSEPVLPGRSAPFDWAVTRRQAWAALEAFIATRLDGFGPYQDAMVAGQPTLWHALLSPYLNLGLLHPLEVIRRLEQAGLERSTPLACLEGVIRQILGWREYTHGLYWWFGPDYPGRNHFAARRPLPPWLEQLGGSGMACMDTVLAELAATGYAHHIQRLMVLANYGLIAGLDPQALTAWFHRMFIDGYDWVMQTNVIGMGLFADGGLLASKPYAASGSYINRMSNYCKGCRHDPRQRSGPQACPFNALYWDFLARHHDSLARNPRMSLMIRQLEKLPEQELAAIRTTAQAHLAEVEPPPP